MPPSRDPDPSLEGIRAHPAPEPTTALPPAHPGLLAELAEASAHLERSALAARTLEARALAESIDSVELQANDLMRRQMRDLRIAAGVTQAELARRVGDRPRTISEFETGKRAIDPAFVLRVSTALGAPAQVTAFQSRSSAMRLAQTAVAGEETRAFEIVASGISMEPTIRHGDRLLVTHEVTLAAGRIVVAIHNDVWIVKRLAMRDGELVLRSDNADEEVELAAVEVRGIVVELNRTI